MTKISLKIKKLLKEGIPKNQAIAIALSMEKRKEKKSKKRKKKKSKKRKKKSPFRAMAGPGGGFIGSDPFMRKIRGFQDPCRRPILNNADRERNINRIVDDVFNRVQNYFNQQPMYYTNLNRLGTLLMFTSGPPDNLNISDVEFKAILKILGKQRLCRITML